MPEAVIPGTTIAINNMKKSFILYTDTYEPIKDLTLEEKGELFDAIFQYQINPNNPLGSTNNAVKMAFSFFKAQFVRDSEKWREIKKARKEAGKKGGLKRVENERLLRSKSSKPKQTQANQAVSVSVSVNDSVNKEITGVSPKELIYLEQLPVEELEKLSAAYNASAEQIRVKALALHKWCKSKGAEQQDYKAFLESKLVTEFGLREKVARGVRGKDGLIQV